MAIHRTAIIEGVSLSGPIEECTVGPYAVIGYNYEIARAGHYGFEPRAVSQAVKFAANVFVGSHAIISAGVSIGNGSVIEHQCFIGEDSSIGEKCFIRYRAQIFRRVVIGSRCIISGFVCNDTIVDDDVVFFGSTVHRFVDRILGKPEPAPTIKRGAFVGFNALIVGGVTIGEHAIVKPGAVVMSSVPDSYVVEVGETYRG